MSHRVLGAATHRVCDAGWEAVAVSLSHLVLSHVPPTEKGVQEAAPWRTGPKESLETLSGRLTKALFLSSRNEQSGVSPGSRDVASQARGRCLIGARSEMMACPGVGRVLGFPHVFAECHALQGRR